ncbi:hypothetical protein ACHHYP_06978 [Achlya hypogyna]|uniref:PX domain-containing protein n=1 Tax=Achlya hypogyna TaxID=1202772 RepID=A0A1V9YR97_ACHHY|nr:hypothetical protein ACHHYP_06978 [Achlya hypogyna]
MDSIGLHHLPSSNPCSPSRRDFGYQTLNLGVAKGVDATPSSRELFRTHTRSSTGASPLWLDVDMATLPDGQRGPCETFCLPQNWSSAFASPRDFTLKAYETAAPHGKPVYTLAIVSLAKPKTEEPKVRISPPPHSLPTYANDYKKSLRSLVAASHAGGSLRSNAWIKTEKVQHVALVRKTAAEIKAFVHTMAFRLPGHNLAAMFKHKLSKATTLEARAEAVVDVLSYILSITHVGLDCLVPVKEPMPQDMRVRLFFELAWGSGLGLAPTGSNSCDGRLESSERLGLPTEWLMDMLKPSSSAPALPKHIALAPPIVPITMPVQPPPQCTLYVPPHEWHRRAKPGAFTVQVTHLQLVAGAVHYTLTVLYHDVYDTPLTATVARRYSEFHALATCVEAKTRLPVLPLLPPKTLFGSTSVRFVEHRSVRLQQFLDALLGLSFTGMLDQTISMVAEPNVRAFLGLPAVQWSVVPQRLDRFRAFSNSPTVSSSASPIKLTSKPVSPDDDDDDDQLVAYDGLSESPYCKPRRATNPPYPAVRAGAA